MKTYKVVVAGELVKDHKIDRRTREDIVDLFEEGFSRYVGLITVKNFLDEFREAYKELEPVRRKKALKALNKLRVTLLIKKITHVLVE
jgi:hypothetical protein